MNADVSKINLYHFWKVLTDEDEKGKAIHNVPGWGNIGRKRFRETIGLLPGYNLSVQHWQDCQTGFIKGWYSFADTFIERIKAGGNAQEVYGQLIQMADEFGGRVTQEEERISNV
jgi:hypothetical protein